MPRIVRTAEEIQTIVEMRVDEIREVREDGDRIGIPVPQWHEPDEDGCNWSMNVLRNPGAHLQAVLFVIAAAQTQFNLPT